MEEYCLVRFNDFKRELSELERGRNLDYLSEIFILKGIIKSFELLFDLSWKTMKDIMSDYYGVIDYSTGSPRDNIEQAFRFELISDNGVWLSMLKDRNLLTHDYDEEIARTKIDKIKNEYFYEFKEFELKVEEFLKTNKPL